MLRVEIQIVLRTTKSEFKRNKADDGNLQTDVIWSHILWTVTAVTDGIFRKR